MKRRTLLVGLASLLVVALLLAALSVAEAQTGGPYDLTWSTIDGGGHMFSTGGVYALGGTIGQADAGALSGGVYALRGGFWGGGARYRIYLPLVLRSS
jgi:hypothetical protein